MVVQFCEAQILVREVVQLNKRRRNRHIADLQALQQILEFIGIYEKPP